MNFLLGFMIGSNVHNLSAIPKEMIGPVMLLTLLSSCLIMGGVVWHVEYESYKIFRSCNISFAKNDPHFKKYAMPFPHRKYQLWCGVSGILTLLVLLMVINVF